MTDLRPHSATSEPGATGMTDPILPVDRMAAADAVKAYRDQKNANWQQRIRNGECDDGYMVQAFAAHRITATTDAAAQIAGLVDNAWETLKQRCCANPAEAKRCVMVSEDDFRAALSTTQPRTKEQS